MPRAALYLAIRDEESVASPHGKAQADLICAVALNLLSDESYLAASAELELSIKTDESGFVIQVWGFSHHVKALSMRAVDTMVRVAQGLRQGAESLNKNLVGMERDALARRYRNADANPARQASNRWVGKSAC